MGFMRRPLKDVKTGTQPQRLTPCTKWKRQTRLEQPAGFVRRLNILRFLLDFFWLCL